MSNKLTQFSDIRYNKPIEELKDKITSTDNVPYEKYTIPVKNGELRIIVEDGVPCITYLSQSGVCVVEMVNNNKLRFINLK